MKREQCLQNIREQLQCTKDEKDTHKKVKRTKERHLALTRIKFDSIKRTFSIMQKDKRKTQDTFYLIYT